MLAPLVDKSRLEERLDGVSFFFDAENGDLRQFLVRSMDNVASTSAQFYYLSLVQQAKLKQFRDVEGIFKRIKNRCASVGDWCRLIISIRNFTDIQ